MKTCRCGAHYTDDPAGRNNHRQLHGHTPVEEK